MADRYPNDDVYGRGDSERARPARWIPDEERHYGGARAPRRQDRRAGAYAQDFDQDFERDGGGYGGAYAGGYGPSDQAYYGGETERDNGRRYRQGGQRGPSHGGYRGRDDWERDDALQGSSYGQREQGYGGEGWRGPASDTGNRGDSDRSYMRSQPYGGQSEAYGGFDQSRGQGGYLTRGGRRQWGRFAGRGPKNYTRSDDRIRDDINDRLTDDPDLDATEIEVKVTNCDVVLSGTVDSREAKRRAEDCADTVSGVKNVQNNLRVQTGEEETTRPARRAGRGEGDNKMQ